MAKKEVELNIVLEVTLDDGSSSRHEFRQKSVIIGSGPAANLKLEQATISGVHAILRAAEDESRALLSDLGSEEGTKVNGKDISRDALVQRGDTITVGNVDLFVVGVGTDAVETKMDKAMPRKSDKPAAAKAVETAPLAAEPTKPDRVERKGPPKPPPARKVSPDPAVPATGTAVIRKREIPRAGDMARYSSGQNFFERELAPAERPRPGDKLLEVKVMWGRIVLLTAQFEEGEIVTVGDHPKASLQLSLDRFPGEMFTLASPGGPDGHVVHVASGMELDVRHKGEDLDVSSLPSEGAVRTYALRLGDKARVSVGQVAFLLQHTSRARGVVTTTVADYRMAKWWSIFFILAIGTWLMIEATPRAEFEAADYLKNPARFAQLIMPSTKQEKKSFEELKKKKEEKPKADDSAKWEKVNTKVKAKDTKEVPREIKEKQDRKIATSAGILGLLKGRGGGTGDNASSVFGGAALTSLDQSLEGLRTGMGDTGGFGGLGTRGGGPGGGGGLGLGGLGTAGYGRGEGGAGYGSVKIGHRGKSNVQVVKGRTRIIGGLSQEVVGRYIKRYWAQFKFCYERELSKNPNLYGKITTTFTIAGNGRVGEAQVIQSTMHNANVEECLLRVIRRIHFPNPKGGGQVIVTYPFMFTTAG